MITLTVKQKQILKKYCEGFQPWIKTEEGASVMKAHRDHEKNLKKKLSKKNIASMDSEGFSNLYKEMWVSKQWRNKDWGIENKLLAPNGIENIRSELMELLYSKKSISERYDKVNKNIKGFGPSTISEILLYVFPDECCIWNAESIENLSYIGIDIFPDKPSRYKIKTGSEYSECIRVMKLIKETLRGYGVADFIDLDVALYYITVQLDEEEFDNDDEPESDDGEGYDPDSSPYSIEDIVDDGCFVEESKLYTIKSRLENTKNLILEGPPGTGKTYLAKMLAFALVGHRPDSGVVTIQFHPNLTYEDFVRGYRPHKGDLGLVDGQFLEMINKAKEEPDRKFVIIIDEINRGNPANIFGEMFTLIESDKRNEDNAVRLGYFRDESERVYVPPNLYIIGTMNGTDRSIALLDMALRRRFDFVHIEPVFDERWSDFVHDKFGVKISILNKIKNVMMQLNKSIEEDSMLGLSYKIGHSYAIPKTNEKISDAKAWWEDIVEYNIGPLLQEYWFEEPEKAQDKKQELLSILRP